MKRILSPEEIPEQVLARTEEWNKKRRDFDPRQHADVLQHIFTEILTFSDEEWDPQLSLRSILGKYPKDGTGFFSKSNLVAGYTHFVNSGLLEPSMGLLSRIRMKPMRTASGVAPVTVLTAPAGCPSACIFCPDDYRMPKSYIHDEPGCQRAERDGFDPFRQTRGRIQGFEHIGHAADKVELLILGGTWSAYSRDYREWYIRRCFDAMNERSYPNAPESTSLQEAMTRNQTALHRNVGLVVETRPDWITPEEVMHLRRMGVTKVQIGVQSLDDRVLKLNNRGHDVQAVREALNLLRTAGLKLHLHWMPNLFGATLETDRLYFNRFFSDLAIRPDELKIYPCSLIRGTELFELYRQGKYEPYTEAELVGLLADIKPDLPPYLRVNRLFRDIPAHHIEAGVTTSNLREVVQEELRRRGKTCGCIRCREINRNQVSAQKVELREFRYETSLTEEIFLSYEQPAFDEGPPSRIAGFLRLSHIKDHGTGSHAFMSEINGHAMVRELHVYGPAQGLQNHEGDDGAAQHKGLGTRLLEEAARLSRLAGYTHQSVIAAVGTRPYYAERGFEQGELYMHRPL